MGKERERDVGGGSYKKRSHVQVFRRYKIYAKLHTCSSCAHNHKYTSKQHMRNSHITHYAHFVGVGRRVARMMEGGSKLHVVGWGVAATGVPMHGGNTSVRGHAWSQRRSHWLSTE